MTIEELRKCGGLRIGETVTIDSRVEVTRYSSRDSDVHGKYYAISLTQGSDHWYLNRPGVWANALHYPDDPDRQMVGWFDTLGELVNCLHLTADA